MKFRAFLMVMVGVMALTRAHNPEQSCKLAYVDDDGGKSCDELKDGKCGENCWADRDYPRRVNVECDEATVEKRTDAGDDGGDDCDCSKLTLRYDSEEEEAEVDWGGGEIILRKKDVNHVEMFVKYDDTEECTVTYENIEGECFDTISSGALAGIIIGALVAVLVIAWVIGLFCCRSKAPALYPCF